MSDKVLLLPSYVEAMRNNPLIDLLGNDYEAEGSTLHPAVRLFIKKYLNDIIYLGLSKDRPGAVNNLREILKEIQLQNYTPILHVKETPWSYYWWELRFPNRVRSYKFKYQDGSLCTIL